MIISDIYFKNMWGTTSKKNDPKVGTLVCSSPAVSLVDGSSILRRANLSCRNASISRHITSLFRHLAGKERNGSARTWTRQSFKSNAHRPRSPSHHNQTSCRNAYSYLFLRRYPVLYMIVSRTLPRSGSRQEFFLPRNSLSLIVQEGIRLFKRRLLDDFGHALRGLLGREPGDSRGVRVHPLGNSLADIRAGHPAWSRQSANGAFR